jgi:hypothetical protein
LSSRAAGDRGRHLLGGRMIAAHGVERDWQVEHI